MIKMVTVVKFLLAVLAGFIIYGMGCWAGKALIRYSEPKFAPYPGPKFYKFKNGSMEIWFPKGD